MQPAQNVTHTHEELKRKKRREVHLGEWMISEQKRRTKKKPQNTSFQSCRSPGRTPSANGKPADRDDHALVQKKEGDSELSIKLHAAEDEDLRGEIQSQRRRYFGSGERDRKTTKRIKKEPLLSTGDIRKKR